MKAEISDFIGLRHIGRPAKNLAKMAAFYRHVLRMSITKENATDALYDASVFLARHPEEEDHDLVFFENAALAHTAFRVARRFGLATPVGASRASEHRYR